MTCPQPENRNAALPDLKREDRIPSIQDGSDQLPQEEVDMKWEKLTTSNIVTLVGGIGAVVVSLTLGFFINDSLKADLR